MPIRIGLVLFAFAILESACGSASSNSLGDAAPPTSTATAIATASPTPSPTPEPTPAGPELTAELGRSFWAGNLGIFPLSVRIRAGRDPDTDPWTLELGSLELRCTPEPTADGWHLEQCDGLVPDLTVSIDVPRDAGEAMPFELIDGSREPALMASGVMHRIVTTDEDVALHVVRNWRSRDPALGGNTDIWSESGLVFAPHFSGHIELLSAGTGERISMIDINAVLGLSGRPAAALDVKSRGGLLYVATVPGGVLIYDITDATQPEFAGQFVMDALNESPEAVWNIHNIFLAPKTRPAVPDQPVWRRR